jgi:two-component system, OmpR family, response regulator
MAFSSVVQKMEPVASMRILVVEDEFELAALIVDRLQRSGFEADHVGSLQEARKAIAAQGYSLALLDRRLPDGDSISLVPEIRRSHPGVRILMLTAHDAVSDKIAGLEAGADDYLTKPFDVYELMARIRANLRRSGAGSNEPPVTVGALSCDLQTREAFVGGRPLVLHQRELALLESLVRRAGRTTSRETLLAEVYDGADEPRSNALDALISRLRKHLNDEQAGVSIHPIRGVGYLLAKSRQ